MKKKFVQDLKFNEVVDSFFMLHKKEFKIAKNDKPYLALALSDKTGRIEGRLWDNAEKFNELADTGDVVHVKGTVEKYREEKQLKVDSLAKADERLYSYEDMVRVAENRDKVLSDVSSMLLGMTNPWLKALASKFLDDAGFMALFKDGIGGKLWHNAYIGGLLEHTYEVMYIVDRMCGMYPEANRDLVLFGAFLHDIGKVYELDCRKMEYTDEGGLVGHIVIGHKILVSKMSAIEGFPPDLALRLEHVILSHHGEYEQQSPVLPKTLEATIIYHADELVSQANAIKEIQKSQAEEGKVWSHFVGIKNRKYYIRDSREEEWARPQKNTEKRNETKDDLFGS
jgi:3'-5' exoribonuclease